MLYRDARLRAVYEEDCIVNGIDRTPMSAMLKIALIVWMYDEDVCRHVETVLYMNTQQKFEISLCMNMLRLPYNTIKHNYI